MDATQAQEVIFEYWDVPEDNHERWLDYYTEVVVGALRHCDGYGGTIFLREQPSVRPGPRRVVGPHFGSRLLGVRTNAAVNLSNLLAHEYTFLAIHFMTAKNPRLLGQFFEGWKQMVPEWRELNPEGEGDTGNPLWLNHLNSIYVAATNEASSSETEENQQASVVMSRQLFGIVDNHWDVMYDLVTSREAGER